MNASAQFRPVSNSEIARGLARTSAAVLLLAWSVVVISELLRFGPPAAATVLLGVAFATVFAGYVIGWRNELIGGIVSLVGMVSLLAASAYAFDDLPERDVLWFAIPGVFYLVAWFFDRGHESKPVR